MTEHRDKLELLAKTLLEKRSHESSRASRISSDRPKGKHADGLFSEAKIVDEVITDDDEYKNSANDNDITKNNQR